MKNQNLIAVDKKNTKHILFVNPEVPMKKCSYCGKEYPDDAIACAIDQTQLNDVPEAPLAVKRNSKEPLDDQRQKFGSILAAYRRGVKMFMLCVLAGVFLAYLAGALKMSESPLMIGLFLLCIATALTIYFRSPRRLICPSCSTDICRKVDHYCPECDGSHLADRSFFGCRCSDCGKQFRSGNYTIHFCTSCGAYLSEKGVRVTASRGSFTS